MTGAASVSIREARASDMPAITAIYAHHVLTGIATFELDPPDTDEMTKRFEAVLAADLPYLAAEAGGEILGYAYAAPYRARPAYRFTVESSVYLSADHGGKGIGFALMQRVIDLSTEKGRRRMIAVISDDSGASVRLHEKLGFAHAGVLPAVGYKFGRWLDTVFMERALGEGDRTPPQ